MVPVIVVEDEPLVGELLVRALCKLGWTSRLVLDPLQVDQALEAEHPVLLLSDLRMPGRSGVDVLAFARKHYPSVKRCLISGTLGDLKPEDIERIRPCFLLEKPWNVESLRLLLRDESVSDLHPDLVAAQQR